MQGFSRTYLYVNVASIRFVRRVLRLFKVRLVVGIVAADLSVLSVRNDHTVSTEDTVL